MFWTILFGGAFLAAAVYNLSQGDYVEGLGGLVIGSALLGSYFFFRSEEHKAQDLLAWVADNAPLLERGNVLPYQGMRLSANSELVRFQACLSFLVVSTTAPSRYFVKGEPATTAIGLLYNAITLVFGWWGIPWGPVWTIKALVRNLRGGERLTVADLLDAMAAADAQEAQAPA